MTEYDRSNTGALFEPRYQKLMRYGRINVEGNEDTYAIIEVKTKTGKTVYEIHKRVGALFPNAKQRDGKRDPDTYGKIEVPQSNVLFNVSGWKKTSKNDEVFTSVSLRLAQLESKESTNEPDFDEAPF